MIATLEGTVAEKLGDLVVLNVHGVGYGLLVPLQDAAMLKNGETGKVYTYEHIRENTHELYGFCSLDQKQLFEQLLDVNGVGPKMALNILNLGSPGTVRTAIAAGDTKFIQGASGVGRRVAERVVVELKDKVGLSASDDATQFLQAPTQADEATQALMALGYTPQDAALALVGVDANLPTSERIRQALKGTTL